MKYLKTTFDAVLIKTVPYDWANISVYWLSSDVNSRTDEVHRTKAVRSFLLLDSNASFCLWSIAKQSILTKAKNTCELQPVTPATLGCNFGFYGELITHTSHAVPGRGIVQRSCLSPFVRDKS